MRDGFRPICRLVSLYSLEPYLLKRCPFVSRHPWRQHWSHAGLIYSSITESPLEHNSSYSKKKKQSHCTIYRTSNSTFLIPLNESKRQRANYADSNHSPTSLLHLLVVDHARSVPRQMPEAVERVVGERQRNRSLRKNLERQRPGGEAGGNDGTLEVPADGRRDQVCGAEDVKGSREGNASDTVEGGAIPGDLGLVDAEMGCDGAVQALLCEDLVAGLTGGEVLGGGGSAVGSLVRGD